VYSIQHYVIKFVNDLWHGGFLLALIPVSSINKTDHHDITKILLKVALNTLTLTQVAVSLIGQAVRLVIMYIKSFIVFIGNIIMCWMSL
jgi:hypothetical protein